MTMVYLSFLLRTRSSSRTIRRWFRRLPWILLALGLYQARMIMTVSFGTLVAWTCGASLSRAGNPQVHIMYAALHIPVAINDLTWGFQIHDLKFSNDGQQFLCISGTIQAKLFDRDGEDKCVYSEVCPAVLQYSFIFRATYIKGDPYIRDMKNTS